MRKDILILGEGTIQRLDDTTLLAEAKYSINFTKLQPRFVLTLYCSGSGSFSFVDAKKLY